MTQTAYSNVTTPLLLHNHVEAAEAVVLSQNLSPYLGVTGAGAPPLASGGYVVGINALDRNAGETTTASTDGVEIGQVKTGATVLVDQALSVFTDGTFQVATGTDYVVGHARDNSAGSLVGTPHFIRVALRR